MITVDLTHTSQRCSGCTVVDRKFRDSRSFRCISCHHTDHYAQPRPGVRAGGAHHAIALARATTAQATAQTEPELAGILRLL
ncbi:hypothetical protein ACGFJC_52745 [Nonomuraea fuscirosea]|uniref:hypothetical protein n=1 Tax=Nonomuraea fuscirosea TaxID=1291556 RepID=UPI003414414D